MKNNIFNYEGEEKELSLSSVKEIKSNNPSDNSQNTNKKNKVKFENIDIPNLSILNKKKTIAEKSLNKDIEPKETFERRKKKFHTLMVKEAQIFDPKNKKKKRKKKKNKTVKVPSNQKDDELGKKEKETKYLYEESLNEENEEFREEFEDKEIQTKLEIVLEKKFTPIQTMLSYCKCQLFISYDNMSGFQYTGLEGILCIMINRILSNLYLQVYDILDFKKQFEIELYTNIMLNKGYEVMTDKFHAIEFPTFCLGINFYTIAKAKEIKNIILNYSKALNSSLFYQYEKKNHDTFKQKKLFDFISDPTKVISFNDKKKKTVKENNNQTEYNNNIDNENGTNYLESIFGNLNKKLNYKISSNEQLLSFSIDKEAYEVTFDTSKGANRFLEQNNIEILDINEEYEKMKEKVKSKIKNNKLITNKTKKSIQEEIKDKENKEKIMEILNQIEGLQVKDKNNLNSEEEKNKFNNKIKKFNVTKRLPLNQTMVINSPPDNLIFYGEDSDHFGDEEENNEEDDEEGEEEEDDEEEKPKNEKENNFINNLIKNNKISNEINKENNNENNNNLNLDVDKKNNENNNNNLNLEVEKNNSEVNSNIDNKSIKLELSGIKSNSSEISSNSIKDDHKIKAINNINNYEKKNNSIIEFSSNKNSSIKKSENKSK